MTKKTTADKTNSKNNEFNTGTPVVFEIDGTYTIWPAMIDKISRQPEEVSKLLFWIVSTVTVFIIKMVAWWTEKDYKRMLPKAVEVFFNKIYIELGIKPKLTQKSFEKLVNDFFKEVKTLVDKNLNTDDE